MGGQTHHSPELRFGAREEGEGQNSQLEGWGWGSKGGEGRSSWVEGWG